MEKVTFTQLTTHDLETVIIDCILVCLNDKTDLHGIIIQCVNSCLKVHAAKTKELEAIIDERLSRIEKALYINTNPVI